MITGVGTGATATARVSQGVIIGITLTNPGTGYTTAPTVTIRDPSPRAKGAVVAPVMTAAGGAPTITVTAGTGIRKFIDSLPQLNTANNLGQMLPIAVPDTITYPGSDYYIIAIRQYTEKMHTDLPATTLRGYVQINNGTANGANTVAPAPIHYLGPIIVSQGIDQYASKLSTNFQLVAGGNLFIPVDTTYMGAGAGPNGGSYTQNRVPCTFMAETQSGLVTERLINGLFLREKVLLTLKASQFTMYQIWTEEQNHKER